MRFPVVLLGLLISSFGIGVILWVAGASFGKSLVWALVAFFIGQVLYVVVVGLLARGERTGSSDRAADRKPPDPAAAVRRAQLATRNDHQV
jgi:hypothetical protein